MSDIKFEKCNDKEINDKCEVISDMTDEIAALKEANAWHVNHTKELHEEIAELREMLQKFIPSNDYYETNEDDGDMYCNYGGTFEYNEDSEHIGLEVVKLLNK